MLRLALVRPLGEHATLKANVGRYARAPSFLELYAGTGRLLGNPDLQPERGTNADVALVVEAGTRVRVSSRAAVFGAEVSNLIEWQHDSYGHARPSNVGAARILGAEEELRLAAGRWARFVGQATFLDARDTSDDRGAPRPAAARCGRAGRPTRGPRSCTCRLARGGEPGRGLEVGAFVDGAFVAGSFDDPANLFELPPRLLVGAGVSVEAPRWGARATCSAQNLTDTPVWDMAYWPLPGRTIFLALAWQGALGHAATEPGNHNQNRSE